MDYKLIVECNTNVIISDVILVETIDSNKMKFRANSPDFYFRRFIRERMSIQMDEMQKYPDGHLSRAKFSAALTNFIHDDPDKVWVKLNGCFFVEVEYVMSDNIPECESIEFTLIMDHYQIRPVNRYYKEDLAA